MQSEKKKSFKKKKEKNPADMMEKGFEKVKEATEGAFKKAKESTENTYKKAKNNTEDFYDKAKEAFGFKNNMFTTPGTEDMKKGMQNFMNGLNPSFCGVNYKNNESQNLAKDMMDKFAHNIKHNFEENMELAQDILKCKTATDFIEFQRKNFEINYKNSVRTYSELMHDIQNMFTKNLKDSSNYVGKN